MKQWYETLFENYGHKYDQEPFTQGTLGECDFLEPEIQFNKDTRILDIGCGTGRHAIELTKRGYSVTFKDYSVYETEDDVGQNLILHCNERYYVPSEITWLLKTLDFQTVDIFGAKLGAFSREDQLTTEDYEMLVIAEK